MQVKWKIVLRKSNLFWYKKISNWMINEFLFNNIPEEYHTPTPLTEPPNVTLRVKEVFVARAWKRNGGYCYQYTAQVVLGRGDNRAISFFPNILFEGYTVVK